MYKGGRISRRTGRSRLRNVNISIYIISLDQKHPLKCIRTNQLLNRKIKNVMHAAITLWNTFVEDII